MFPEVTGKAAKLPPCIGQRLLKGPCWSFFPPTCRRLQFAFAEAIAFAFELCDIRVMCDPVNQGDNAGCIGKDFIPFLEAAIGCHDQRSAFIAAIDDLIEKVRSVIVIGQIADLVTKCWAQYFVTNVKLKREVGKIPPRTSFKLQIYFDLQRLKPVKDRAAFAPRCARPIWLLQWPGASFRGQLLHNDS